MNYKKKTRNRFISNQGKAISVMNSKFRAAATKKIPLFISNISKEIIQQGIAEYIRCKTQTDVTLIKIISKTSLFLNEKIWP